MEKTIKTGHVICNRIINSIRREKNCSTEAEFYRIYSDNHSMCFFAKDWVADYTICDLIREKRGLSWNEIKPGQKVRVIGGYLTKGSILVKTAPFNHPRPEYKDLIQGAVFILNRCDDCTTALDEYCQKSRFELIED